VVDGEQGDDDACRPNQVIAVAVTHSPLGRDRWEPVVDAVAGEQLARAARSSTGSWGGEVDSTFVISHRLSLEDAPGACALFRNRQEAARRWS
jgi:hypothetical protein